MKTSVKIRLAQECDLPRLVAISEAADSAAQWTQPQWLAIFQTQTPARVAWMAEEGIAAETEDETRGVGFLVAQHCGPEWELENVGVLPAFRRHGVGQSLLSALLAHAASLRAERILLEVRASNQSAIGFYLANGFQQLARRREYYQHPTEDALIMVHNF